MHRTHNHALTSSLLQAVGRADPDAIANRYTAGTGTVEEAIALRDEPYRDSGHPAFDAAVRALGPIWRYGPFKPGYTETLYMGEPGPNFIAMPGPERFRTPADYRRTVAHELVHWSQHADRANRPAVGMSPMARLFGITPEGYALEEATAEMGSALLVDALGAEPDVSWSASYVAGWTREEGARDALLAKAAEQAEQAVDWLLTRMTAGSR